MIKYLILLLFLIKNIAFAQKSNVFFTKDSTKYQIGIPANRLINSVFPSDKQSFLIEVRINKNYSSKHNRFGIDYNVDTSESGGYRVAAKYGMDWILKKSNKWVFYYGIDLSYSHNYLSETEKHIGAIVLAPLMGIMFKISKNFSISTEPNLFLATNFLINNNSFDKNANSFWFESGFGKVGFLQINFHF